MEKWWKFIYIFLFGSLAVLIITHPKSAATVFGTLFSGFNGMGTILSGSNSKAP